MALSGRSILSRAILTNLRSPPTQTQPCGVDLSLSSISSFASAGILDFSNTLRRTSSTEKLPSQLDAHARHWDLPQGCYLVEFNENVKVPLDCVGFVYPRSSAWRSGVGFVAGVVDAGYEGALGGCLQVCP